MKVLRDPGNCPAPVKGSVVTIGAYDGVHLGHRAVIAEVRRRAGAMSLLSAVVTFDPHPAQVVRPESAPLLLCDLQSKLELLEGTGIDTVMVVPFDRARSEEEPEDFVTEVLVGCLGVRSIVVGEDFHFGRGRRGNVGLLEAMGAEHGFDVEGLALRGVDGLATERPVSSTRIRRALDAGELGEANMLLGRHHEVRGRVVHGEKRGRDLGYPTANIEVPESIQLPADGIYAGWFERADGSVAPTAISLGRRPTFHDSQERSLLECHLLGFSGDLYGESVAVSFVARLRGELRFDSVEALIEQIERDCAETSALLVGASAGRAGAAGRSGPPPGRSG